MTISESLIEAIKRERQQRENFADAELLALIANGNVQEAADNLVFFTKPENFLSRTETLQRHMSSSFYTVDEKNQESYLEFLVELTLSLRSFLPRWNLQDSARYGDANCC